MTKRIIPCLDVKDGRVVKGVNFRGFRVVIRNSVLSLVVTAIVPHAAADCNAKKKDIVQKSDLFRNSDQINVPGGHTALAGEVELIVGGHFVQ